MQAVLSLVGGGTRVQTGLCTRPMPCAEKRVWTKQAKMPALLELML